MINLTFLTIIFSELFWDPLDKLPIAFFGFLGLYTFFIKRPLVSNTAGLVYLLFCLYLIFTSFFQINSKQVLIYGLFYFAQFGLFVYILSRVRNDHEYSKKCFEMIVNWQSIIVVVGIADLILYMVGIETPLRDHVRSFKVDSFYKSPNILGVVSSLVCVYLLFSFNLFKNPSRFFLYFLNILGAVISGSSMAILIIFASLAFKVSNRYFFFFVTIFSITLLASFFSEIVPDLLNRRTEIWKEAFYMWEDDFLIGIGSGNFQILNTLSFNGVDLSGVYGLHSFYMWLIIETGLIGLFIFSLFAWSVISGYKCWDSKDVVSVLFISIAFSQLTENYIDHEEIFVVIFWLLISCMVHSPKVVKDEK